MRQIIVTGNEAGTKLFAFLCRKLPKAPGSILHKSIRNKNIVVNHRKAAEKDVLKEGDCVEIYFSEETFEKFSDSENKKKYIDSFKVGQPAQKNENLYSSGNSFVNSIAVSDILYEDEDILAVNKAAGILSQKAKADDVSLNEMIIAYLLKSNQITESELMSFRPSVQNRLDRNTSGIVLFGKTQRGMQYLSRLLRDRTCHKYYQAVVAGRLSVSGDMTAYLIKDKGSNTVSVSKKEVAGSSKIITGVTEKEYYPDKNLSLVELELKTGKPHQLRAFLAYLKNPILGDPKYGNERINKAFRKKRQLLHAYRVILPDKNLEIVSDLPEDFKLY